MSEVIYFDTSALAKWYLNEPRSDEVEEFIQKHGPVTISDLTVIEMRSLLSRQRREKNIDSKLEAKVFATFQEDIREKFLVCHPFPPDIAIAAVNLISVLADIPLRSLDAMHLVIAKEIQAEHMATADRVMADAAELLGISVVRFD